MTQSGNAFVIIKLFEYGCLLYLSEPEAPMVSH